MNTAKPTRLRLSRRSQKKLLPPEPLVGGSDNKSSLLCSCSPREQFQINIAEPLLL
ncbi:hypothetical protein [Catalinimonas niigatensis]|uniref:hypothetical protein n=1 Tax=Catalinimonas niigatensis TaxID=1397264 RepID=UPI002666640E|nr:hypothetical protein [Catalinimonas niigatensis]WPP51577.1 hypothetical protein PZB72_04145 [Catalinimonas niigatensis]